MSKVIWVIALLSAWALPAFAVSTLGPAPAPVDCSDVVLDMMDCLSYVSDGSNVTSPGAACCSAVKTVVKKSPLCLCAALKEAADMDFSINSTRALVLPKLCLVPVPDLGGCGIASPPGPAPAPSAPSPMPTQSSPSPSPSSSPTPSASPGSSPVPSPAPASPPPTSSGSPAKPPVSGTQAPTPAAAVASSGSELSSSLAVVLVILAVAIGSNVEI